MIDIRSLVRWMYYRDICNSKCVQVMLTETYTNTMTMICMNQEENNYLRVHSAENM